MAFEFKKLSDVEVVVEPSESTNVLIEENGVIKKAPKTAVGGANGASGFDMIVHTVVDEYGEPMNANLTYGDANNVKQKINNGESVMVILTSTCPGIRCVTDYSVMVTVLSDYLQLNDFLAVYYNTNIVTKLSYEDVGPDPV